MKANDILADDVNVGRPIVRARAVRLGEQARRRHIVVERIDPHVHDVPRRVRHRDAPVERRSRDREIFEPHFDEADDFVAPFERQDEFRICRVMGEQLVLICGQAEEIGLLLVPFDGRAGRDRNAGTVANLRLALLVVGLVAYRVPAAVHPLEDVAGLFHASPKLGAGLVVTRLRRANEIVVRETEHLRHVDEARRVAVGEFPRRDPFPSAVCFIFSPCSSVPVRKNTSLPSSRSKRAITSVAIAS